MARIMQEEFLTNERNRTEGYMVAVDADTYEEARALAYQRWAEMKPEVAERIEAEEDAELADAIRALLRERQVSYDWE